MIGLDVGTSFVISARNSENTIQYKEVRDAFYRLKASSPIAAKMLEKGLQNKTYIKDDKGEIILIGQDAIEKAIEHNKSVERPMVKGVLSPKEKDARKILKFILSEATGKPKELGEKLVYCVPGQPIDQPLDSFDITYHQAVLKQDLTDLGFSPVAINEAEAIAYSELSDDDYTGIAVSCGAGMVNVAIMSFGDVVAKFATTTSGDWLDRMVSTATALPDSVVQAEKEAGTFTIGEQSDNSILNAYSVYYQRMIAYTAEQIIKAVSSSGQLPKFKDAVPVVVGGGTSLAKGFVTCLENELKALDLNIKEVRPAEDPLRAVSRGCLIAASL